MSHRQIMAVAVKVLENCGFSSKNDGFSLVSAAKMVVSAGKMVLSAAKSCGFTCKHDVFNVTFTYFHHINLTNFYHHLRS